MELTNPQLYALFAIAISMIVLGGIAYCLGLKTGHAAGQEHMRATGLRDWKRRYQQLHDDKQAQGLDLAEAKRLLDCQTRELATLRRNIQAEAEEHGKVELGLLQRLAAATPLTDEDQATMEAIAAKLELAASTFAGLGSGDHARFARQLQQYALNMAQRLKAAQANTKPHPDTELIEWLESDATVDFDLETATLRFQSFPGSEAGISSVRALLRQAKADSEEIDRNHTKCLEAAA